MPVMVVHNSPQHFSIYFIGRVVSCNYLFTFALAFGANGLDKRFRPLRFLDYWMDDRRCKRRLLDEVGSRVI